MSTHMINVAEILKDVQLSGTMGRRALRKACHKFTSIKSLIGNGYIEPIERKSGETQYRLTEAGRNTVDEYERFIELCVAIEY